MCMIGQLVGIIDVPEEEPVYALRKWTYQGGNLYPAYRMYLTIGAAFRWEIDRPTVADCYHCSKPSATCMCGLYGMSYYEDSTRWGSYISRSYGANAYGVIKMWGRVAVHDDGYRAQYAQPVATTKRIKGIPRFSWRQWKKKVKDSRTRANALVTKKIRREMEEYYKELTKEGYAYSNPAEQARALSRIMTGVK